ncbi:MAG: hypothetical protein ACJ8EL_15865 [Rhizomicrobium sp.]
MADKTIPKLIFVLLVLCVFMAAPMAYLSHDRPTIMQTRFMDSQNVAIDPTLGPPAMSASSGFRGLFLFKPRQSSLFAIGH